MNAATEIRRDGELPRSEMRAVLTGATRKADEVRARRLEDAMRRLRRDDVERPTVFVGTGTCGLGAGAGKTLAAVKELLATRGIDGDVVEVGCIGLCASEPMVDVQLPGRARLSFGGVTAKHVAEVVGGTLDATGGHNLLEPALFAKPVIFGPNYRSARMAGEALLKENGGFLAGTAAEISATISKLLDDRAYLDASGENAAKALSSLKGATARSLDELTK